jgi:integrase
MSLKMPNPIRLKSVYYLSVRVPTEHTWLRGMEVELPVGDTIKSVKIGSAVRVSLDTGNISEAKRRFARAHAALLDALGEAGKKRRDRYLNGSPASNEAHERAMSEMITEAIRDQGMPDTREVRKAMRARADAEYALVMAELRARGVGLAPTLSFAALFDRWANYKTDKRAKNTLSRYRAVADRFSLTAGSKDISKITPEMIYEWAVARGKEISPRTVNGVDLVVLSSVLGWATTIQGGKLLKINPAAGVRLDEPVRVREAKGAFNTEEIRAILIAAREVEINPLEPWREYARRWVPWICAYTGARVADITNLRAEDFEKQEDGWGFRLLHHKIQTRYLMPVHQHLIEEGLITYVLSVGTGPLFFDEARPRKGYKSTLAETASQDLAKWVRRNVTLRKYVSPNHGWRHTFSRRADQHMSEHESYSLTGHLKENSGAIYRIPEYHVLAKAMKKFPAYDV